MKHTFLLIGMTMSVLLSPLFAQDNAPLLREIQRLEQLYGGHLGVMAKNLRTGETVRYNAEERFPTASLIKYPVMVAYFKAVADGRVKPDQKVTLTAEDKKPGFGHPGWS